MTTEQMPASGVAAEQVTPVEPVNETPEVTAPESNEQEQSQQQDATPEKGDEADRAAKRMQRRIDRVTAARYQAEAEARHLREQLEAYQRQQTQEDEPRQYSPEDIDRLATERAREIAQAQSVQSSVSQVIEAGKAIAQDFDDLCNEINEEVKFYDRPGKPSAFLEAVLDADKPAELLAHLGRNPELLDGLQDLTPARLGRKLAAIESAMSAKPAEPKRSNAPAPLRPVTPTGASATKSESEMTDAEWYAARRKR